MYFGSARDWVGARSACGSIGAHLVEIGSLSEQSAAAGLIVFGSDVWVGLNDRAVEGSYVWDLGGGVTTPLGAFTNWRAGEPDGQDCVFLRRADGSWEDDDCTRARDYVCERP